MLVTGISLAIIAGMPLGRIIGLHLSWRATFLCIGGAALLAFVMFAFLFPPVPNNQNASVKSVPQLLKTPVIRELYIFTFVAVAAHYTGYSYIEPFMKQVVGMADDMTTFTLILFGLAGIGASVLFSRYFDGRRRQFIVHRCRGHRPDAVSDAGHSNRPVCVYGALHGLGTDIHSI